MVSALKQLYSCPGNIEAALDCMCSNTKHKKTNRNVYYMLLHGRLDPVDDDDVIKWNIFRVAGSLCGEFTGHLWIPSKWQMTRIFDDFFDLRLN